MAFANASRQARTALVRIKPVPPRPPADQPSTKPVQVPLIWHAGESAWVGSNYFIDTHVQRIAGFSQGTFDKSWCRNDPATDSL